jgi:hypothetical protein
MPRYTLSVDGKRIQERIIRTELTGVGIHVSAISGIQYIGSVGRTYFELATRDNQAKVEESLRGHKYFDFEGPL